MNTIQKVPDTASKWKFLCLTEFAICPCLYSFKVDYYAIKCPYQKAKAKTTVHLFGLLYTELLLPVLR